MIRYSVEPSPGTHIIYWGGTWIKLDRVREQQQVSSPHIGFLLNKYFRVNLLHLLHFTIVQWTLTSQQLVGG